VHGKSICELRRKLRLCIGVQAQASAALTEFASSGCMVHASAGVLRLVAESSVRACCPCTAASPLRVHAARTIASQNGFGQDDISMCCVTWVHEAAMSVHAQSRLAQSIQIPVVAAALAISAFGSKLCSRVWLRKGSCRFAVTRQHARWHWCA
jgi:hypothetical protein